MSDMEVVWKEWFKENVRKAAQLVVAEQKSSATFIQYHLRLGYNYAHDVQDELVRLGVVSEPNHVGKRTINYTDWALIKFE